MRDRILKTLVGAYKATDWWGRNTAGFEPLGDMVLVLPDEACEVTTGGIIVPTTVTDANTMAAESGTLVAIGAGAFLYTANGRPWAGAKPQVGDRVRMQRYAGQIQAGRDKHAYRLMTDTCIGAVETADESAFEDASDPVGRFLTSAAAA